MPEIYKVLGQNAPALDTLSDLYEVPAGASAVAATLIVAHVGSADDPTATFRVSVAIAGEADAPKQIIMPDVQLAASTPWTQKLGLTLGAGDVVRVRSRDAQCAFNLFGTEIT